jgi:hypothetical protein
LNSNFFLALFQPFSDDYVATSSGSVGRASKPKEVPCSEVSARNLSSRGNTESIIIESLRKEIKILKAQCLAAIAQTKKLSDREEASRKRAIESDEVAHTATAKWTQAVERETYLLELMTSSSQELIGKGFVDSPRAEFCCGFFG